MFLKTLVMLRLFFLLHIIMSGKTLMRSRSDNGRVDIRSGVLTTRKAGSVAAVNVAPNEPLNKMGWLREKPVPKLIISTPSS